MSNRLRAACYHVSDYRDYIDATVKAFTSKTVSKSGRIISVIIINM